MLHKKTQDIPAFAGMSCSTMYLYFIVSYFTFTFTLYVFPVVRSFTVTVAFPFFKPLIVPFEDTFTTFLLDVVNFKISGSKYPFFSFLEMYTLVCSCFVCDSFFARCFDCGSCFVINST